MSLSVKRLAGDVFDEITSGINAAMLPFGWETEHIAKPATRILQKVNKAALAPAEQLPFGVGKKIKYAREHIQEPFGDIAGPTVLSPSNFIGLGEVGTALKLGSKIPKVGKYLSAAERFSSAAKNSARNVANVIKVRAAGKLQAGQAARVPKFLMRTGHVSEENQWYNKAHHVSRLQEAQNEVGAAGIYTDATTFGLRRNMGTKNISLMKIRNPEKLKFLDVGTKDGRKLLNKYKAQLQKVDNPGYKLRELMEADGWDGVLNGGLRISAQHGEANKLETLIFREKNIEIVKKLDDLSLEVDIEQFLRTGVVGDTGIKISETLAPRKAARTGWQKEQLKELDNILASQEQTAEVIDSRRIIRDKLRHLNKQQVAPAGMGNSTTRERLEQSIRNAKLKKADREALSRIGGPIDPMGYGSRY